MKEFTMRKHYFNRSGIDQVSITAQDLYSDMLELRFSAEAESEFKSFLFLYQHESSTRPRCFVHVYEGPDLKSRFGVAEALLFRMQEMNEYMKSFEDLFSHQNDLLKAAVIASNDESLKFDNKRFSGYHKFVAKCSKIRGSYQDKVLEIITDYVKDDISTLSWKYL